MMCARADNSYFPFYRLVKNGRVVVSEVKNLEQEVRNNI